MENKFSRLCDLFSAWRTVLHQTSCQNITNPIYLIVELIVLKQAKRELEDAPRDVIQDIFALFDDLMAGKHLSMPISRPLSSIAKGLHELRLSGRAGEYRVFYVIRVGAAIYVLHATSKKTQKADRRTLALIQTRLRSLGL